MEEDFGVKLFVRTTRSTRLTCAGKLFQEHVPRVFTALQQARDSVKAAVNSFHGQLRAALSDALETVLCIHFLQQWYALSDPAIEEALYGTAVMSRFARLGGLDGIPDETTILNFRRLLATHDLAARMLTEVNAVLQGNGLSLRGGTIVDATVIAAPSSTKNAEDKRDPQMHQTRKGNQWYFGMKAHIAWTMKPGWCNTWSVRRRTWPT